MALLVLLLFVVMQAGSEVEPSALDPEPSSVPVPTNLKIEAFNLDARLDWVYPPVSQTPVFTVQVKTYMNPEWIDTCNTSHHYCYISPYIDNPSVSAWARVKARLGQNESFYAESKEFILCKQGKIGPPSLIIRRKEDQVITDIIHPLNPVYDDSEVMYNDESSCDYSFIYTVHIRTHENKTKDINLTEDDCNETQCQFQIPVQVGSSDQCDPAVSNYCAKAQGLSERWNVATEMSPEVCVNICRPGGNSMNDNRTLSLASLSYFIWIPICATFLFILILTLAFAFYRIKKIYLFRRESIMLPKSLVSVVKSASSETKPESKYISTITYQPAITENENVVLEEQLSSVSTTPGLTEDSLGKVEHGELCSITEVIATEAHVTDVALDSSLDSSPGRRENSLHSHSNQSEPCSVTFNSYHSKNGSDSGLVESDSFLSDSEFPPNNKSEVKTEVQEFILPRNTTTSFGYDKPHVLVDLLVDGDAGKESLLGYRLTAESKEFS